MTSCTFALLFYKDDPKLNYLTAEMNISLSSLSLMFVFLIMSFKRNYDARALFLTAFLMELYFSLGYHTAKKACKLGLKRLCCKKAYGLGMFFTFLYVHVAFAIAFLLDALMWLDLKSYKNFLQVYYCAYLILTIINFIKYHRKNV